jgi:hypothetical protein
VNGILADHNIEKHVEILVGVLLKSEFADAWTELRLAHGTAESFGLPREVSDRLLWSFCQANGLVLLTDNRNYDGPDSLDAVLNENIGGPFLPVLHSPIRYAFYAMRHIVRRRPFNSLITC